MSLNDIDPAAVTAQQAQAAASMARMEGTLRRFGDVTSESDHLTDDHLVAIVNDHGSVLGVVDAETTDAYLTHLTDQGGTGYFRVQPPADQPQSTSAASLLPSSGKPSLRHLIELLDSDAAPSLVLDALRRTDDPTLAPLGSRTPAIGSGLTPIHDELAGEGFRSVAAAEAAPRGRHDRAAL